MTASECSAGSKDSRDVYRGSQNLLRVPRQALKDRRSIGEVCGAMRDGFGEYKPTF